VFVSTLTNKFLSGNARTVRAKKNIVISFALKFIQIGTGFLIVPLALDYLDPTRYGIWLTLSSIVSWFSLFDVGLGNGLRNRLSEALARGEDELARNYTSTAYFSVFLIAAAAFAVFLVANHFVDWASILNTKDVSNHELSLLATWVFGLFFLRLVFQLLNSIIYAIQQPALIDLIATSGRLAGLLGIYLLVRTTKSSLLYLGVTNSVIPVAVLFVGTIVMFSSTFKKYLPCMSYFRFNYLKDILGLGGKFFLIQVSGVILYTTDNIIIAQLFSPAEVTPYQIANRYFGMVLMGFMIVVTPFWSAITEAFIKKEFAWIRRSVRRLVEIWGLTVLLLAIMLALSSRVYIMWIGDRVIIPFTLSLVWSVFIAIQSLNAIFVHFVNGTGKIKLQMILALVSAAVNIPLSILLAKYLNFGVAGVISATIVTQAVLLLLTYLQYRKIVSGKAVGIWAG
jgi:O-antigen/teichoic acid export membrane protein